MAPKRPGGTADRRALEAFVEDLLSAPKHVAETLEWKSRPGNAREFEVPVLLDEDPGDDQQLVLYARVNALGEWSYILVANGSIEVLRGCSNKLHSLPGYHGLRHPQLILSAPHQAEPDLTNATAEQALQHFCRRANIRFTAEQMDFGRTLDDV